MKTQLFILEPGFYLETAIIEFVLIPTFFIAPNMMDRIPFPVLFISSLICMILGFYRLSQWKEAKRQIESLSLKSYFSVDINWLKENIAQQKAEGKPFNIYVGKGYIWETKHTARYHQLRGFQQMSDIVDMENEVGGLSYIHNIGLDEEKDMFFPIEELKHTIIGGTTRVGKTRMIELLTYQIICAGECLIVVDPKGDAEMLDSIYAACVSSGREKDFIYFSLTHPAKSATMNPVASFLKPADIASRVASILPQGGDSKPFTDFCWKVLVGISDVLVAMEEPVTIKKLHKYSLQAMDQLYTLAQDKFAKLPDGTQQKITLQESIERLRVLVDHPREHFAKMIGSLEPLMASLATGEVGQLLSPDRPTIMWEDVVKSKKVVYFYLASMVDGFTASSVGKLAVQDLLNYVGQIYAYETTFTPINLFVDEFYSVMFEGYVDLLNKAGGAGMRVFLALQTTSDITSVTDQSRTKQILGNVNNKFYLRVPEKELADEFCELFGEVKIKTVAMSAGFSASPKSSGQLFSTTYSAREQEVDVPLLSSEMIMSLPKGQAFVYTQGRQAYKIRIPMLDRTTMPKKSFTKSVVNVQQYIPVNEYPSWYEPEYQKMLDIDPIYIWDKVRYENDIPIPVLNEEIMIQNNEIKVFSCNDWLMDEYSSQARFKEIGGEDKLYRRTIKDEEYGIYKYSPATWDNIKGIKQEGQDIISDEIKIVEMGDIEELDIVSSNDLHVPSTNTTKFKLMKLFGKDDKEHIETEKNIIEKNELDIHMPFDNSNDIHKD